MTHTLVILPGVRNDQAEGVGEIAVVAFRGVEIPAAALAVLSAEATALGISVEQHAAEQLTALAASRRKRSGVG
jgi:hypothetical protein